MKRPLEFFETLLYCAHQKGMSQMTVAMTIDITVEEEKILTILKYLFFKHALLRSRIINRDKCLKFVIDLEFEAIPIFFLEQKKVDINQHINDLANCQLDLSKYNWKAEIIVTRRETHILFHFSHVIADGLSMISFCCEVLQLIDFKYVPPMLPTLFYGSYEKYLKQNVSIEEWQSNSSQLPQSTLQPAKLDDNHKSQLPYEKFSIPAKNLGKLKNMASSNHLSVNAILTAAYILAYWQMINDKKDLTIGSALNIRNKCQPKIPSDVFGNYFTAINTPVYLKDGHVDLLSLAKNYYQQLGNVINAKTFMPSNYNQLEMYETVKAFMLNNDAPHTESLNSSYMGEIKFKAKRYAVTHFSIRPTSPGQLNLMSWIYQDTLECMLCYPVEYRSAAWVKEFAKNINAILSSV